VKLSNSVIVKVHVNQLREFYSNARLSNSLAVKIPITKEGRDDTVGDVIESQNVLRRSNRVIKRPNRYSDSNF
jgi:hypothetical protein